MGISGMVLETPNSTAVITRYMTEQITQLQLPQRIKSKFGLDI